MRYMSSVFIFLFIFIFVTGRGDVRSNESVNEVNNTENAAPLSENIVLEDGSVEQMTVHAVQADTPHIADERMTAIEDEARQQISILLQKISELEDKSDEGELQRQIEKIKLKSEIARFEMYANDAEGREDWDLVYQMKDEINHLENIDQSAIAVPESQPRP